MITSQMAPLETAHQLHLGVRFALEVHAANRALVEGTRNAVLRKISLEPLCAELVDAKRARKKTATVLSWLEVDEPRTVEAGGFKSHD